MAWITPVTDWQPSDGLANTDMNRIEGNTLELYEGLQTWLNFQQSGGTIDGNVVINGTLGVSGNVTITGSTSDLILPNNYGIQGKLTNNSSDYMLYMDSNNVVNLSYNNRAVKINGATTINGTGTINGNFTVNTGGTSASNGIFINGSAKAAKIWCGTGGVVFQTNDASTNLHFGCGNSNDMVINAAGNVTFAQPLIVNGGYIHVNGYVKSTNIPNSSGGMSFSSGGANRRFFIGTGTDWGGGQPPGTTWGDIWIMP